jgi:pimeloyl-ACP methyl ester carboxylesterase
MAEEFCQVGDIRLCYETFGEPADPAMLLVMGLGTQMVGWHEDFCRELAGSGFFVIRFDNRDIGRSSRVDAPPPTLRQLLTRSPRAGAYRLSDMAADAVGLLDHLGVGSAHVVGASMGGMIAQTIAACYPQRVRSLASIMSNTGNRWRGQPHLKLYPLFLRRAPQDREGYVDHIATVFSAIGSPGFPRDIDEIREVARTSYDRGHDPDGGARQLGAIVASGDRTAELRRITVPTVVIHGTSDRLVSPSGGRATVKAIRGARLVTIEGMGHDLPRGAWPRIIGAIVGNAQTADRAAETAGAAAA